MLRFLIGAGAIALVCTGLLAFVSPPSEPATPPTVEVDFEHGHGSGFHIGKGYIVTAAHVAKQGYDDDTLRTKTLLIKDRSGGLQWGEVVWLSEKTDVALIRVYQFSHIAAVHVSAAPVKVGDELHFVGNPYDLGPIVTYGHVASEVRDYPKYWSAMFFVNAEVRPGMSGGPALNSAGEVVGVNVGQEIKTQGLFGATVFPSIGMIVPVTAFADLLPK